MSLNSTKSKLLTLAVLLCTACTDEANTERTLKAHGFTQIRTTGYEPFACSEDDTFKTGFSAKNPAGDYVQGTVCCGWMKNCTVRF